MFTAGLSYAPCGLTLTTDVMRTYLEQLASARHEERDEGLALANGHGALHRTHGVYAYSGYNA